MRIEMQPGELQPCSSRDTPRRFAVLRKAIGLCFLRFLSCGAPSYLLRQSAQRRRQDTTNCVAGLAFPEVLFVSIPYLYSIYIASVNSDETNKRKTNDSTPTTYSGYFGPQLSRSIRQSGRSGEKYGTVQYSYGNHAMGDQQRGGAADGGGDSRTVRVPVQSYTHTATVRVPAHF